MIRRAGSRCQGNRIVEYPSLISRDSIVPIETGPAKTPADGLSIEVNSGNIDNDIVDDDVDRGREPPPMFREARSQHRGHGLGALV